MHAGRGRYNTKSMTY